MAGFTGSHNPLLANYFDFVLDRVPNMTYFCQAANLPGLAFGVVEQPTSLGFPIKIPSGAYKFQDLEITFKVDENMNNWLEIWRWMKSSGNYGTISGPTSFTKDPITGQYTVPTCSNDYSDKTSNATLSLTNSVFTPRISVSFKNLFPISLTGLQFSTGLIESAEVTATATFTFTSYDILTLENG
jgi:hypothetical protein